MTMVKRMIAGQAENKYAGKVVWDNIGFNSSISAGDLYGVLPKVIQGDKAWERSGAYITPKYLLLRGTIALNATEADSLGARVRLMVLSAKGEKSYLAVNTAGTDIANTLLDQGFTPNTAPPWANKTKYDGSPIRHLFPVNKDNLVVHHDKRYSLFSSYGSTANQHSGDDTRRFIEFTLKVKCPKKLVYEDALDPNYPTNFAPFICLGFTYPDGTTPSVVTTPILGNLHSTLIYEDV